MWDPEASGENRADYVFMFFCLWWQEHVKLKPVGRNLLELSQDLVHGYHNTATPYGDFAKFINVITTSVKWLIVISN